jgi:type IX secretion system PorP/SprF family membrane protein
MGIGLTIFRDVAGVARLSQTSAMLNMSGLLKIGSRSALSVGLAGGTAGTNASYDRLTYASQFNGNSLDPAVVSGELPYRQFTTVDVAAGVAYEFMKFKRDQDHDDITSFKISLGAFHLNRPEQEFGFGSNYRKPIRYAASVTSVLDIEDTRFTLTPAVVYQIQGSSQLLMLGSHVRYRMSTGTKMTGEKTQNAIGFGVFYRNRDALIPQMVFDFGDLSFGLSYDVVVSGYRNAGPGSRGLEVSLRYNKLASSLFDSRREYR